MWWHPAAGPRSAARTARLAACRSTCPGHRRRHRQRHQWQRLRSSISSPALRLLLQRRPRPWVQSSSLLNLLAGRRGRKVWSAATATAVPQAPAAPAAASPRASLAIHLWLSRQWQWQEQERWDRGRQHRTPVSPAALTPSPAAAVAPLWACPAACRHWQRRRQRPAGSRAPQSWAWCCKAAPARQAAARRPLAARQVEGMLGWPAPLAAPRCCSTQMARSSWCCSAAGSQRRELRQASSRTNRSQLARQPRLSAGRRRCRSPPCPPIGQVPSNAGCCVRCCMCCCVLRGAAPLGGDDHAYQLPNLPYSSHPFAPTAGACLPPGRAHLPGSCPCRRRTADGDSGGGGPAAGVCLPAWPWRQPWRHRAGAPAAGGCRPAGRGPAQRPAALCQRWRCQRRWGRQRRQQQLAPPGHSSVSRLIPPLLTPRRFQCTPTSRWLCPHPSTPREYIF